MKKSEEYRSFARQNLKNNWGTAILVCVVILLLSSASNIIPVIGYVVSLLLAGQLAVGEFYYYIALHNKENASFNHLFKDFGTDLFKNFVVNLLQTLYLILWFMLFIIPGIIKVYSYSMTMYLKAKQPNLQANEAITLSRKIMDGKKWKLFCLQFSFIGWIILSIITLGIGLIFLLPYMQASTTAFFEDAYAEYQQTPIVVESQQAEPEIEQ